MGTPVNLQAQFPIPCVLYVDDELSNLQAFMAAFRKDFKVLVATSLPDALELLATNDVHVVVADQRMPGTIGTELLACVRDRFPRVRRMLMTGYSDIQAVIDAINNGGVMRYISKPWEPEQVLLAVRTAFNDIRNERDKEENVERLKECNSQLEFALRQALLS